MIFWQPFLRRQKLDFLTSKIWSRARENFYPPRQKFFLRARNRFSARAKNWKLARAAPHFWKVDLGLLLRSAKISPVISLLQAISFVNTPRAARHFEKLFRLEIRSNPRARVRHLRAAPLIWLAPKKWFSVGFRLKSQNRPRANGV